MTTTESLIERDLIAKLEDLNTSTAMTSATAPRWNETFAKGSKRSIVSISQMPSSNAFWSRPSRPTSLQPPVRCASTTALNGMTAHPLAYTLVNIRDWCKNSFEVVNQLCISTDNSHHRYDVILLINGVPSV